MTRKDYILIARALADSRPTVGYERNLLTWNCTARLLADALAADNPRFDREHFLRACRGDGLAGRLWDKAMRAGN